ncbi:hypothetical protein ACWGCW_11090 [Streptomyces sp. NPDC054933]
MRAPALRRPSLKAAIAPPQGLRHRRCARAEDRIRAAHDTGLRILPLHGCVHDQIWTDVVSLATASSLG